MNVALSPRLSEIVERKLASGEYVSACEVIQDALSLLEEHDRMSEARRQRLREDIAVALDEEKAGDLVDFDKEEIKRMGRELLARSRRARNRR